MGIGFLTLFVGTLSPISSADGLTEEMNIKEENYNTNNNLKNEGEPKDNDNDLVSAFNATTNPTYTSPPSPTPSPSPTPTPPPVFELVEGGHPDIEKFFQDYYVIKNSCDYTLLKSLMTDPDKIQPLPDLQKETRFLDDIRDITCYIMKSYEEDSYIVYVYHEIKYINIKTPYPKLDKFYLITDEEGNLKIFSSEMDETLKAYYEERDEDEKVLELIQSTNEKAKEALNNDVDLRVYLEALYK